MSERRGGLSPAVVFAAMFLLTAAMTVAVLARSREALTALMAGVAVLAAVVLGKGIRARDPGARVPPYLERLDPDDRRLVAATALRGLAAPDPVLAEAVVTFARRRRFGDALFLVSSAVPVGFRVPHVLDGVGPDFDTIAVTFYLVCAYFLARNVVRLSRAIALNR